MTSSFKRQAVIVAGMHRSGTSAITRVLSLLGADLPKNLAPPIPDNNETGFWESVNLMVLHDKLLASAGSSWSDWTEFNRDWYLSTEGKRYYTKISSVVQADFEVSSLFVVKDPRICRILPFWLNLLQDHAVEPFVIIPVRNPLEVARSLKARDGFPLAKGALIWLRHVLDAVFFASNIKVAFVSYEQLMSNWKAVTGSITQQCGLYFPRISVAVESEIDRYLDDKQKHNNSDFAQLRSHPEFSPVVIEAYELLQALTLTPDRPELRERLCELRNQFNVHSLPYAKVLNSTEVMYEEQRQQSLKQEQQSAEYIAQLKQQMVGHEERLSVLNAEHEEQLRILSANAENRVSQLDTDYANRLDRQAGVYESALQEQTELQQNRENHFNQQLAEYEARLHHGYAERKSLIQLNETQRNDLSLLRLQLVKLSDEVACSAKPEFKESTVAAIKFPPCNADIRKAGKLLALLNESALFDVAYYRQAYPELVNHPSPLEQHYLFLGGFSGFKPHVLFDSDFYQRTYPDVAESKENPLVHFLQKGGYERRQTHLLFDVLWYVGVYPDVAQGGQIPLLHYLQFGGQELRNPHPLFLANYYVDEYPDVGKTGLPALVHYLKYGSGWRCNPHPLFDGRYYLRQLGEDLPSDTSALEHFLGNKKSWRISPCACFDSAWYLDQYPDVWDRGVNPLLHYVLHGHADGRKPHPAVDTKEFRDKYAALFARAHLQLGNKSISAQHADEIRLAGKSSQFKKMVDFPKRALSPAANTFIKDKLVIHWVTCDFARQGGGGNMTIFRFVRLLELFGHQQHIWLHNKVSHQSTDGAYEDLVRYYQQTSAQVHFIEDATLDATGDIIIATDWESVWPVLSAQNFKRRFYFVQDHEPSFFAVGGESLAAEMTYREELDCICAGPWLETMMRERYGRWACKFWLAADQQIYYPTSTEKPSAAVPRIAFYARASTSRRAVELGLLALELLFSQGKKFHVDVYGSNDNTERLRHLAFSYTDHGVLAASGLGELYRQCDVGVVFSATNYSLVPQEMMACGLAVLELDGDNTRSVFPSGTVELTLPHPRYIAEKLGKLLEEPDHRMSIANAGMVWAQQFDWEQTARDINTEIQSRLQELGYVQLAAPQNPEPMVTVVIPTLNGGDLLLSVLDKLKQQKAPWPFEVLVIDSGSDDGTLATMRSRDGLRVHPIPKSEFSHGGTRNLGVELSSSKYIAFLTQDALPADDFWLFHLVSSLEHEPDAAGAFGKHLPYPGASPFVKRDLVAHFENLGRYPLYLGKETDAQRFEEEDESWRQILHFYSDNNSCLRRSAWERIPYPVIEYGEDQVWADQIIKAGYKKAYAINAVVYHSHDYDEQEVFERSRIEAEFFWQHFGYEILGKDQSLDKLLLSLNENDRDFAAKTGVAEDVLKVQYKLNTAKLQGWKAGLL